MLLCAVKKCKDKNSNKIQHEDEQDQEGIEVAVIDVKTTNNMVSSDNQPLMKMKKIEHEIAIYQHEGQSN